MKKLFRCLITLSLSVAGLSACSLEDIFGGGGSKNNDKPADHIEVRDYSKEVYQNEKYTFDGKVFAVYSDETEANVTKKSNFTTLDTEELGEQELVVRYEDSKYIHKKTIKINVVEKEQEIALKSITIPANIKAGLNKTKTVTPTFTPSNATNKQVTYEIANTSIATVATQSSGEGVITPLTTGTTTLTVKSVANPSVKATANLSVESYVQDNWTILVYMCGANLESDYASQNAGAATEDLIEIAGVSGQPDDVNIVVQAGGANKWSSKYSSVISADKRNRFHLKNKTYVKDSQTTKVNLGLEESLKDFLVWGINTYPAEKIGLIFWNHGGAITGACFDEQFGDDGLSPDEMVGAISDAKSETGYSDKFEFIGYDCCLMQFHDLAGLNAPYAKYQVASEESEWGYGWSYDKWIDDLYNSSKTTEQILTALVDGFIEDTDADYERIYGEETNQTQSFVDLSYWDEYQTAWENVASSLNSSGVSWSNFSKLLKKCGQFGDSYDLYDIGDFCSYIKTDSNYKNNSTLMNRIAAVETAYSNLVVHEGHGSAAGNVTGGTASGLALFAPVSGYIPKSYYTSAVSPFTTWLNYCRSNGSWGWGGY